MPAFILAYVYMALFDFAGRCKPRCAPGSGRRPGFPKSTRWEAPILVLSLVLYPYVYLLARAALLEQAASTFEAARLLGYSRSQTFFKLVLPLARPSLAAGMTLAMLEALTDFGARALFQRLHHQRGHCAAVGKRARPFFRAGAGFAAARGGFARHLAGAPAARRVPLLSGR